MPRNEPTRGDAARGAAGLQVWLNEELRRLQQLGALSEGVLDADARVPNGALDFRVAEQDLYGTGCPSA